MKKNYNPFKMLGVYIGIFLGVGLSLYAFFKIRPIVFFDLLRMGYLAQIFYAGVIGGFIGWLINSIIITLRRK